MARKSSKFLVGPSVLCTRIFGSFMPPFLKRYNKLYDDYLGPFLSFVMLVSLLQYHHNLKSNSMGFSPLMFGILYVFLMPVVCKILLYLSGSEFTFSEIVSLLGYALYGHVVSLCVSILFYDETSNLFFFLCLILFCGCSTFRLTLLLLRSIPKPGARLLVCSLVGTIQILSLIFVHFAYMHKKFVYGVHRT